MPGFDGDKGEKGEDGPPGVKVLEPGDIPQLLFIQGFSCSFGSSFFESWLFYDLNPGLFLCVRVVGLCWSGVVVVPLSGLSSRRGAEPQ